MMEIQSPLEDFLGDDALLEEERPEMSCISLHHGSVTHQRP